MNTNGIPNFPSFVQESALQWNNYYGCYDDLPNSPNTVSRILQSDEASPRIKYLDSSTLEGCLPATDNFTSFPYVNFVYLGLNPEWIPNYCYETTSFSNNSDNFITPPTVQSNYHVNSTSFPYLKNSSTDCSATEINEKNIKGTSTTETSSVNSPDPACFVKDCENQLLERKYQCEVCSKQFSKKYVLKRHLGTHNTVKMYNCSACRIGFYRKDIYDRHMKTKRCQRKHQAIATVKSVISRACSNSLLNSDAPLNFGFNCFKLAQPVTTNETAPVPTYHNILNHVSQ